MHKPHNVFRFSFWVFLTLLVSIQGCDSEGSDKCNLSYKAKTRTTIDIGSDADPDIVASLPLNQRSFLMGTAGFVPPGFPDSTQNQWQNFFDQGAALWGGLFGTHVSAYETKTRKQCNLLEQLRMANNDVKQVVPYFLISAHHEQEAPFTKALGEELVNVARDNAKKFRPLYFGVGNEINSYWFNEPNSYDLYVEYITKSLKAIKEVSPDTITFTNFQLEYMKGAAQLSTNIEPNWQLLDDFANHVDAFAFTVYPYLHYKNVEDIPADYLEEIRNYTNKPIIITETGWPTQNLISEVVGSDEKQITYMQTIAEQANDLEALALIWVLPHDGSFGVGGGVFDNISLFNNNGTEKPAYEYWKAIHALEYTGD